MSSDDTYGIPREFLRADLRDFEFYYSRGATAQYAGVRKGILAFLKGEFQSLFFFGHNGSGKSHVGCAILNRLRSAGRGVRCVSVFDFFEDYKENQWVINPAFLAVEVLLLEELGKTYAAKNDILTPPLERLIKSREESGKRTIYTSNCGLSDIEAVHGATIMSMIKGKAMPVHFPDVDWRVRINLERVRSTNGRTN